MKDFTQVYEAVIAGFRAEFGEEIDVVDFDVRKTLKSKTFPVCEVLLYSFGPGKALSDGRSYVELSFSARFFDIETIEAPRVGLRLRNYGLRTYNLLRGNAWGLDDMEPIEHIVGIDDSVGGDVDEMQCWLVEWVQEMVTGDNVWERFDSYEENLGGVPPKPDLGGEALGNKIRGEFVVERRMENDDD